MRPVYTTHRRRPQAKRALLLTVLRHEAVRHETLLLAHRTRQVVDGDGHARAVHFETLSRRLLEVLEERVVPPTEREDVAVLASFHEFEHESATEVLGVLRHRRPEQDLARYAACACELDDGVDLVQRRGQLTARRRERVLHCPSHLLELACLSVLELDPFNSPAPLMFCRSARSDLGRPGIFCNVERASKDTLAGEPRNAFSSRGRHCVGTSARIVASTLSWLTWNS